MDTQNVITPLADASTTVVPMLRPGDRLTQAEFHRRYERMPDDAKFELIGGVVSMASPMRSDHGDHHFQLNTVAGVYVASTPGVRGSDNASVILGHNSEPQPDVSLRLLPEFGGNTALNNRRYITGAPEWLAEVSDSTEEFDLGEKRLDYQRNGVLEYVVLALPQRRLRSFDLQVGQELPMDSDGVFRSRVLPGFWIDEAALLDLDLPRLLQTLNQGLASPEHAAFVAELQRRKG